MSGWPIVASLALLWVVSVWALDHRNRQLRARARWEKHIADLRAQHPGEETGL